MIAWLRKNLLRISLAALVVMGLMYCAGRLLPHHMLRLSHSATRETHLMFGSGGVGVVTVSDPTGYAIPYVNHYQDLVDPAAYRELPGFNVPLVCHGRQSEYVTRQGSLVSIRSWYAIYLLFAAAALLVVMVNAAAWSFGRASAAVAAYRVARGERRFPRGEHCPVCGYDVRESADRCPECGQAFERRTVVVVRG